LYGLSARNRTFFSLDELSEAVAELLERLNTRPFKKLDGCRRSAFEQIVQPVLRPLPPTRYEVGMWAKAKVNIDYCVELDGMRYSVPCTLVGSRVELRSTAAVVETLLSDSTKELPTLCRTTRADESCPAASARSLLIRAERPQ
jgi:hypothetical protein